MQPGRFQFRLRSLFGLVACVSVVCALAAWAVSPKPLRIQRYENNRPDRGDDEFQIYELVFRDRLQGEPIIRNWLKKQGVTRVVFFSFGLADDETWIMPPREFTDRLSGLTDRACPLSEAAVTMAGQVVHRRTGSPGSIEYVQITKWFSDTKVEVSEGTFMGPLAGGGRRGMILEKENGTWVIRSQGQRWVS